MSGRYRAFLRSAPGIEPYSGHVDVQCESDDLTEVFRAATARLRATSFPDRDASCWVMDDFLFLGECMEASE